MATDQTQSTPSDHKLSQDALDSEPVTDRTEQISPNDTQSSDNLDQSAIQGHVDSSGQTPSRSSGLPVLALFVSFFVLIALCAFGFFAHQRFEATKALIGKRLQEEKTRVQVLTESLEKTQSTYYDLRARFDLIERAQAKSDSEREALEEVFRNLIENRAAVSLSEIEQLVSIAKRQLFVLGNPEGARVALQQSIEILQGSDQPFLIGLRAAIEKDLAELGGIKPVDLMSLALQLDSLISSVDALPMLASSDASSDMTLSDLSSSKQVAPSPQQGSSNFFQTAWSYVCEVARVVWSDLKSLVEITKVQDPDVLQISAAQQTDLRNTLRLSLLNARLSLLSRHSDLLQSDINRSRAILSIYFDQDNAQVTRALNVLQKVGEVQLDLTLPDLQHSITGLNLAKASQGGTP